MHIRQSRRQILAQAVLGGVATLGADVGPGATGAATQTPQQHLVAMINGFRLSQMIHVAARLGVADQLASGPKTVDQLAAATKTHADSLYRLLRALAGWGVFAEEDGLRFRLTPAAEFLRSSTPDSLRALALTAGEEWMWLPWGDLLHSISTGQTAFNHLYGKNTFDWLKEHPDAERIYNDYQAQMTTRTSEAVAAAYDFSAARTIVDVGGGTGAMLTAVLHRNPAVRGVLFDLEQVVGSAKTQLEPAVARRCDFVGGDFFKAVPGGGDLYVLKNILHDWDVDRCSKILVNCRLAMGRRGKLLVVEEIICGPNEPCYAKEADVLMLVRTGGRNRTKKEYDDLLAAGGFRATQVFPSHGGPSIIEAIPVG